MLFKFPTVLNDDLSRYSPIPGYGAIYLSFAKRSLSTRVTSMANT